MTTERAATAPRALDSRATLEAVVRRLEGERGDLAGPVTLTAVRDHPNSSTGLMRVAGRSGTRDLIAKTLVSCEGPVEAKTQQIEREHRALVECTRMFGDAPTLRVPRPVACFPDLQAVVMEKVAGRLLSDVLGQGRFWPSAATVERIAHACRLCGQWLRHLQEASRALAPAASLDLVGPCEVALAQLSAPPRPAVSPEFAAAVRAHVRALWRGLDGRDVAVSATHGGFAPYNVVVAPDGRSITVIDFASYRTDVVEFDYLKFRGRLELLSRGPSFRRRVIDRFTAAFDEGCDRSVDGSSTVSRLLAVRFALDQMAVSVETRSSDGTSLRRRLALRRRFRHQYRDLTRACRS
ncbi:MAG TPA: phosphotransferase [Methylomirabilota bacterium]|nr:phosphotransferase [Methylomirabilota bacterium]